MYLPPYDASYNMTFFFQNWKSKKKARWKTLKCSWQLLAVHHTKMQGDCVFHI